MNYPSPRELAAEARAALLASPETPEEHFQRLIKCGFINAHGQVTKLLGGDADPEPWAENQLSPE